MEQRLLDEEKNKQLATLLGKESIKIDKPGIVNEEPLKFSNEPARHKLLDLIGDLALIGCPLKAHVLAARPGHLTWSGSLMDVMPIPVAMPA